MLMLITTRIILPRSRKVDEDTGRRIDALIYGPPKHGKTRFLGTGALDGRTAPMALLDFEGGVLDVLDGLPGFGTDCVHIPIHSWDDFNQAYERVRSNDEGFKSVAIDSLSETHIFALMTIIDEQKSRRDD